MTIKLLNTTACNKCNGNYLCIESCHADVLRIEPSNMKPAIIYPEDCDSCLVCEMVCPSGALRVMPDIRLSIFTV